MRKILIILFTLASVITYSQKYDKIYNYGNENMRSKSDSVTHIPRKSSLRTSTIDTTPQIFVKDTSLYYYENGTYHKVGGGGAATDLSSYRTLTQNNLLYAALIHTHTVSQITDYVPTDLTNYRTLSQNNLLYAALSHTHAISDITNLQSSLNAKLNISDSTSMLLPYVRKITGKGLSTEDYTTTEKTKLSGIATGATANSTDAFLLARTNHTGTQAISTVTGLQAAIDAKLNISDTASMLSGYMRTGTGSVFDSTSLSNRINLKLAKSDTAAMLSPYLRSALLSNVNNTSDAAKPVSTATQTALDLKRDKSLSAYSFIANNTGSTADGAELSIKSVASQTYAETIVYNGTAPSGTTNNTYTYNQIGNMVNYRINLNYSVASGTNNTTMIMPLPAGMPTPAKPTGFTAASDVIYMAYGMGSASTQSGAAGLGFRFRSNAANNGFELFAPALVATAYKSFWVSGTYFTN